MNELLGWYGHESTDVVTSNLSNLTAMALPHDPSSTISNDIDATVKMLLNNRRRNALLADKMNNSSTVTDNVGPTNAVQHKSTTSADKQGWYVYCI